MAEAGRLELLDGIEPLIERYDGFLVDQFGVLLDGVRLLAGAREALLALREAGRRVVILSNSGRRAAANEARLAQLGIERSLYAAVVSSGETAWQGLKTGSEAIFRGLGRRCLFFSRGGDRSAADGLDLELVGGAGSADFVLLAGLDPDEAAREHVARELDQAADRHLPLICTNPDLVSLEGDRHLEGPGSFAARYAARGGDVRYVGKPWAAVYRAAFARLGLPPARLCAVGDSLEHDIVGAAPLGVDGALVMAGVHADDLEGAVSKAELCRRVNRLCAGYPYRPRWLLPAFRPCPAS